jgi:serine/threonine-protein kinase
LIGNYRIIEKLGEGGMGVVYRGVESMLDRPVAIKVLPSELSHDATLMQRFQAEAKAQANLNHTNIATLYTFLSHEGRYFMVMELVEGETFEQMVRRRGPIPVQEVVPLFKQALLAIGHAHRQGIIHRDIKPSNIMVNRSGIVKVMDFGIAKILGGRHLTRTGTQVGTVYYMAPEQIQNKAVDIRSDIYSLGVTLYQLASGHLPFDSDSDFQIMLDHVSTLPPLPSRFYPYLAKSIENAILKAMAKNPDERFQTVEEFGAGLDRGESVSAGGTIEVRSFPPQPVVSAAASTSAATAAQPTLDATHPHPTVTPMPVSVQSVGSQPVTPPSALPEPIANTVLQQTVSGSARRPSGSRILLFSGSSLALVLVVLGLALWLFQRPGAEVSTQQVDRRTISAPTPAPSPPDAPDPKGPTPEPPGKPGPSPHPPEEPGPGPVGRPPARPDTLPDLPPAVPGFVKVKAEQLKLVSSVSPTYPQEAKRDRTTGTVLLSAQINENGQVEKLSGVDGPPLLVQAAIEAVYKWRYQPFHEKGRATKVVTTVSVPFQLADHEIKSQELIQAAELAFKSGRLWEAVALARQAKQLDETNSKAVLLENRIRDAGLEKVNTLRRERKNEEALDTIRQMVKVFPGVPAVVQLEEKIRSEVSTAIPDVAPPADTPAKSPVQGVPTSKPVRTGGATQPPTLIRQVNPAYPPMAKQTRVQGEVVLEALINKEGTVQNVKVISGHPLLGQAAVDAVKQWKYKPASLNGEAVEAVTTVTVNFNLGK